MASYASDASHVIVFRKRGLEGLRPWALEWYELSSTNGVDRKIEPIEDY
tara:strand:+ start:23 stop:169 length:147 start_codon:yes stop_codon:yes gene_type:complete